MSPGNSFWEAIGNKGHKPKATNPVNSGNQDNKV
jgi:hypothetical protein